jgi:hypothetical protein
MTKKITTAKSPSNGFARGPGSQMGTKSRAILELLRKGTPKNKLDIEMILGYPVPETLHRLVGLSFVRKSQWGSGNGCYEITTIGRKALGETLASSMPKYAPHINSTMTEIYNPAVHNTSRIGVARA